MIVVPAAPVAELCVIRIVSIVVNIAGGIICGKVMKEASFAAFGMEKNSFQLFRFVSRTLLMYDIIWSGKMHGL